MSNTPGKRQATTERQMLWLILGLAWILTSLLGGFGLYVLRTHVPVKTWNPIVLIIYLITGHQEASGFVWVFIACIAIVEGIAVYLIYQALNKGPTRKNRRRGDEIARVTGADTETLQEKSALKKAQRLGVAGVGLPVGTSVRGSKPFFTDWEAVAVIIAGMRTGKTTSWVIPRLLEAPGAALVTSNKRDVVDATIGPRRKIGRAWIFDPQKVVGNHPQTCWWNVLGTITGPASAVKLADIFVDATREKGAVTNAFFDNTSRDLVAGLLLAAASGNRPITEVYEWVTDDSAAEPRRHLAAAGHNEWAMRVEGISKLVPDTRSGVYAGASTILAFLADPDNTRWITRQNGLDEFSHTAFAASSDTLYALSLEGGGSAAPIIAALTVSIARAALDEGASNPKGRLPKPLYLGLDEAANICPWRELPEQYSHFGSRGIVVDTILQSWSQGVDVWGETGMKKLWGPANLAGYLGGSREIGFLRDLSETIGDIWEDSYSTTTGRGSATQSRNIGTHRRPLATISELAALPLGRAWIFASGATPTLVETTPWMNGPHAGEITQSIREHA